MKVYLAALSLLLVACGDDARLPNDVGGADTSSDSRGDTGSAPACEARLSEVGEDFVEVVVEGECGPVRVALHGGGAEGCPEVAVHTVDAGAGRHVVPLASAGQLSSDLLVVILAAGPRVSATSFGICPAPEACFGAAGLTEDPTCAPAVAEGGSTSLCDERWQPETAPTPGATNDCTCNIDCAAAAPECMTASCVDGSCVFAPAPDGSICNDSDLCTSEERCEGGVCRGELLACPPPGPCDEGARCDPKTGRCDVASACAEEAECTAGGCRCLPGFSGDGTACADIDECAEGTDACPADATCANTRGGYACVCPPGKVLEGGACVASPCACPWDDDIARTGACAPERGRLRLGVHDLWGRALAGGGLTVTRTGAGGAEIAVAAVTDAMRETALDLPLCGPTTLDVVATAQDHHDGALTIRWDGHRAEIVAEATPDAAWALAEDGNGPRVAIGLAHRWFAAHGPAPRAGNRLELLMDHADAWGALHADLLVTETSVTGTSWWWDSDHELVRDGSRPDLPEAARWPDTILGALEGLVGVERRILMNQFVSQDGFFSNLNVDDDLLAHAERPLDDFEYMGEANTAAGRFTVTPPPVDFRARLVAAGRLQGDVDGGAASPFSPPIEVDLTELPLGFSLVDLPIASWHQKFWTFDNAIAYVGGMNAQKVEWDDSGHIVFDARRMEFDASATARREVARKERLPDFEPYKDYMLRIDGPLVEDAVALFHRRWEALRAADVEYADRATEPDTTPRHGVHGSGVRAQLVSTMPAPFFEWSILESLLRAVSEARDYILIEDQYFRAPLLYDAIVERMQAVPGLKLIAVTNAVSEWTDPGCWQTALAHERFAQLFPDRFRLFRLRAFDAVRSDCFFCIDETDGYFRDVVIHSKMVLIDDVYLEVGSCNSNNRGLLYEGELAVVVHDPAWVRAQRARVVSNMLGPGYAGDMPTSQLLMAFDEVAAWNDRAFSAWDDEGMDLDLDGDPIPAQMVPSGFIYPLRVRAPDRCLIEGVGTDIM